MDENELLWEREMSYSVKARTRRVAGTDLAVDSAILTAFPIATSWKKQPLMFWVWDSNR